MGVISRGWLGVISEWLGVIRNLKGRNSTLWSLLPFD